MADGNVSVNSLKSTEDVLFQTHQLVGVETMTAELEGTKEASGHDMSLFNKRQWWSLKMARYDDKSSLERHDEALPLPDA